MASIELGVYLTWPSAVGFKSINLAREPGSNSTPLGSIKRINDRPLSRSEAIATFEHLMAPWVWEGVRGRTGDGASVRRLSKAIKEASLKYSDYFPENECPAVPAASARRPWTIVAFGRPRIWLLAAR